VVQQCEGYFPIVHAGGSVELTGGRGQGILLVDGDLVVTGAFEWAGLIVVRGDFAATAGTALVRGALVARNADFRSGDSGGGPGDARDGSSFQYSTCAIESALLGSARVEPAKQRGWAELW
jgi:hypothetical protein